MIIKPCVCPQAITENNPMSEGEFYRIPITEQGVQHD